MITFPTFMTMWIVGAIAAVIAFAAYVMSFEGNEHRDDNLDPAIVFGIVFWPLAIPFAAIMLAVYVAAKALSKAVRTIRLRRLNRTR